jgi:putative membrane protein
MKTAIKTCAWMAGTLLAGVAAAQSDSAAAKFLEAAIRGNLSEMKMGELAQQRGKSDDVRDFGEVLVADHKMGLQKSSTLAKTLGVGVPTEPSAEAARSYEMLSKLSGEEFDREFAKHMVMDHEKDIAKYTAQTKDSSEPEVAALAKQTLPTLPTLQQHLAAAESLQKDTQAKR